MRLALGLIFVATALAGCQEKSPTYSAKAASCEVDKDCAKGFICTEKKCVKGERSAKEKAAIEKARIEAVRKKRAAANKVKPGEGRLHVRICPGFQNTPESVGTIIATHTETKKKHLLHLALVVPDTGWETEFKFPSVKPGLYEVQAQYGIQVKGKAEVVDLKCHSKVDKKQCKDGSIRLIEVVTPDKEPPVEKDKDGKVIRRPCDFIAE